MYSSLLEVPGMILLFFQKKTLFFVLKDMVRCSFKRVLEFRAQTISLLPPLALISPHFRKREKNISKMPAGRSSPFLPPPPNSKAGKTPFSSSPFRFLLPADAGEKWRWRRRGKRIAGRIAGRKRGEEEEEQVEKYKDAHEEIGVQFFFVLSYSH